MAIDMSISKFFSVFRTGPAKSNRYRVRFFLPKGIPNAPGSMVNSRQGNISSVFNKLNGQEEINIKCHTALMPGRSFLTSEHKQMATPHRVPFSQTYEPVSYSFYTDNSYDVKEFFDTWQNATVNVPNNTMNFYTEYISDMIIEALDSQGNPSYGVKLFEVFPLNVSPIDFSYSNSVLQNLNVTMSYKYWQPIQVNKG